MADAHANFAFSTLTNSPGPGGTSLTVTAGTGTRFPATPFNATVWPATALPTPDNAEIVRVTGITSDTFTITRAQESTTAKNLVSGYYIAATVTAKTLTDIETAASDAATAAANADGVATAAYTSAAAHENQLDPGRGVSGTFATVTVVDGIVTGGT